MATRGVRPDAAIPGRMANLAQSFADLEVLDGGQIHQRVDVVVAVSMDLRVARRLHERREGARGKRTTTRVGVSSNSSSASIRVDSCATRRCAECPGLERVFYRAGFISRRALARLRSIGRHQAMGVLISRFKHVVTAGCAGKASRPRLLRASRSRCWLRIPSRILARERVGEITVCNEREASRALGMFRIPLDARPSPCRRARRVRRRRSFRWRGAAIDPAPGWLSR